MGLTDIGQSDFDQFWCFQVLTDFGQFLCFSVLAKFSEPKNPKDQALNPERGGFGAPPFRPHLFFVCGSLCLLLRLWFVVVVDPTPDPSPCAGPPKISRFFFSLSRTHVVLFLMEGSSR